VFGRQSEVGEVAEQPADGGVGQAGGFGELPAGGLAGSAQRVE
jgi:hypothetical protein